MLYCAVWNLPCRIKHYPHLLQHTRQHRSELLTAALNILIAHKHAVGRALAEQVRDYTERSSYTNISSGILPQPATGIAHHAPSPRRGRRAGSGAADCPAAPRLSRPRRHIVATPVEPGDKVQIVTKSGNTWQALVADPQGSARDGGHLVTLRGESWKPDPMPEGATSSDY